ncbi:MAG: glycosyltransferase, partial [Pseudomonadota bacterium]|nr:glycosyltransferase [Pseudomonadota bacterium]
ALGDKGFRDQLRAHGPVQASKFNWDTVASAALSAFEEFHASRHDRTRSSSGRRQGTLPRLALVSPLPPLRSGIADYVAELLPALAAYYDITCITDQIDFTDEWIRANFPVKHPTWFGNNAHRFDRLLYHFGNSPAHRYMLRMVDDHPGVVVMHDFFLSSLIRWMEKENGSEGGFARRLYRSHGLDAVLEARRIGTDAATQRFPCNYEVLHQAAGALVHSRHAIELTREWYGPDAADRLRKVPFLRAPRAAVERSAARRRLLLADDDFLVCSFGWLAPVKLNDRLLAAWQTSPLAQDRTCKLVFVGENQGGEYGRAMQQSLTECGRGRVHITGFVSESDYQDYLAATDLAVQLRTGSRGETSAAIFDCLRYGAPVIVNGHGSAAEFPAEVLVMMPDGFRDHELATALEQLYTDTARRKRLSENALRYCREFFHPTQVAAAYHAEIERLAGTPSPWQDERLLTKLSEIEASDPPTNTDLERTVTAVAAGRRRFGLRQIFLDTTKIAANDLRTGIERVTRNVFRTLAYAPPLGFRVEPVRAASEGAYFYARDFASLALGLIGDLPRDEPIEAECGDIFVGLDWAADRVPEMKDWFHTQRLRGVRIFFVVYDLLPVRRPGMFPDGISGMFQVWLETIVAVADGLLCISRAVADDLYNWLDEQRPGRLAPLDIGFFHQGADSEHSRPTGRVPADASDVLRAMTERPSFLMVGTIEPRKGHQEALRAVEGLWAEGIDVNLVIVGKQGWMVDEFIGSLEAHSERARRLFWVPAASDEMLDHAYQRAAALLAASVGEGFGLPLIEAARHKLPIIARDIPAFREVAGRHATYFGSHPEGDLGATLRTWLEQREHGRTALSDQLPWLTWHESAQQLLRNIVDRQWYTRWVPPGCGE